MPRRSYEWSQHVQKLPGRTTRCWRPTQVHDVITADSAIINHDVPSPESNGIPLKNENVSIQIFQTVLQVYNEQILNIKPTFFTSKRFLPPSEASPAVDLEVFTAASFDELASCISTSAMADYIEEVNEKRIQDELKSFGESAGVGGYCLVRVGGC